ncbi:hypothetical protein SteCoe_15735 [Stentor coeruleus]|uniref:Uncharacterized protein n=1 Tax=Stentor coeruleus TaxID=5963 RepID=A0A1R2C2V7_9CILI|nr:hypothetical protein SteCoe_15735 [Stentor coeruleus]
MLPRRQIQLYDTYPWSLSETNKRGGTAPRSEKCENIYIPSRVPTSSLKYTEIKVPNTKISIKSKDLKSYKPHEPVRTVSSSHNETSKYKDLRSTTTMNSICSPLPEEIEHIWEEGNKRPKTQNEKCRRKDVEQENKNLYSEAFPCKTNTGSNTIYDIPIIIIRDDKNRKVVSAKRNIISKVGQRPSTFKPGKSNLITSLDQEFLDLFQM